MFSRMFDRSFSGGEIVSTPCWSSENAASERFGGGSVSCAEGAFVRRWKATKSRIQVNSTESIWFLGGRRGRQNPTWRPHKFGGGTWRDNEKKPSILQCQKFAKLANSRIWDHPGRLDVSEMIPPRIAHNVAVLCWATARAWGLLFLLL